MQQLVSNSTRQQQQPHRHTITTTTTVTTITITTQQAASHTPTAIESQDQHNNEPLLLLLCPVLTTCDTFSVCLLAAAGQLDCDGCRLWCWWGFCMRCCSAAVSCWGFFEVPFCVCYIIYTQPYSNNIPTTHPHKRYVFIYLI